MATDRSHEVQGSGVPVYSLALFRILFGLLMAIAMFRFLARGWVEELFLQPAFLFPYPGFEWIRPWPGVWTHWHVVAVAACALGIAAGYRYRLCTALFCAGFTWLELLDRTTYLNHYYLVSLVAGLMIFLPAHRAWSLDALRRPSLRASQIPAWSLQLLRFQFAVVYLFAGLAKLNADWLLEARPMRIWLAARSDMPWLGPWLGEAWVAYAASWFGAAYDLSVPFFLSWRRTRPLAFAAVIVFHVFCRLLFSIGMFPWIMIAGATLFFSPDWPLAFWRRRSTVAPSSAVMPVLPAWGRWLLGGYVVIQLWLPLRCGWNHVGSAWSGEGFNWAWKVMLVEKRGYVVFTARDPARGTVRRIHPREILTPRQVVMVAQDPQLIRDCARLLAEEFRRRGTPEVEIHADAFASLNGRPSQRLIDPAANLAGPLAPGWILPLDASAGRQDFLSFVPYGGVGQVLQPSADARRIAGRPER